MTGKLRVFFIFIFIFYHCLVSDLSAQTKDAELWENIAFSKNLTRQYLFHFNHEGRIANNVSQFHYAYGDFGITRHISKSFKLTLDYVLVWKLTDTRESWRHQWYVAGMYKLKFFKRMELIARSMYQQQYQDLYSSDAGKYADEYFRNKVSVKYLFHDYPYYRFEPYVAVESYYHLNSNTKYGSEFDRLRYFAGVFYSFNKSNTIELYYMIENNYNIKNPPVNFVMGIGYELDL